MYRLAEKGKLKLNFHLRSYGFQVSRNNAIAFLSSFSLKDSQRSLFELQYFGTVNYFEGFKCCQPFWIPYCHFHSLNTHHQTAHKKILCENTRLDPSVHLPVWMVKCLSGNCNGEKNMDEKEQSFTVGEEEKQEKNQICTTKLTNHQLENESLSSEIGDTRDSQESKVPSKEQNQQECSHGNHSDLQQQKQDFRNKIESRKLSFKKKLEKRLQRWESITDSFQSFPYFISEETKGVLIDTAGARLKQSKQAEYGRSLPNSSQFILLEGPSGTEIYQEKLISALAKQLKVSLLVLDSEFLASKEFRQEVQIADLESEDSGDEDEGNDDDDEEDQEDQEGELEKDECTSNDKGVQPIAVLKLFDRPSDMPKFMKAPEKYVHVLLSSKAKASTGPEWSLKDCNLKVGDRVKFIGIKDSQENKPRSSARLRRYRTEKYLNHERKILDKSKLKIGQLGVVASLSQGLPGWVAVNFNIRSSKRASNGKYGGSCLAICAASDLEKVEDDFEEKVSLLPVRALCEMLATSGPVIVYFPDIQQWLARAVPETERHSFIENVKELLAKVHREAVFVCGYIKDDEDVTEPRRTFKHFMEDVWSPLHRSSSRKLKRKEVELAGTEDMLKFFENNIKIYPPKDEGLFQIWKQQLEQQKKATLHLQNLKLLAKILEDHRMRCTELSEVDTLGLCLTKKKAEQVVGWARNHYLTNFNVQSKKRILFLPGNCFEVALRRLKTLDAVDQNSFRDFMVLADNEYEKSLLSSVIPPEKIGVQFDQIGALDDVKRTLKELIILPLQRPELFRKGNLRKPCKGVLLFGPPGTGKTLLAKAVATESGANFINISASSVTSKWYGDAEKLTTALFTLARKLAPVIIFIDELDGILGARGSHNEHEITRRQRNEFMAAWDGLQSHENERILILATTNRPFDLDDAVIRRLPRRIFIDLPNLETRTKILQAILAQEELVDSFDFRELANQTEGYSGSDLKNLCVSAAYRPVRELLETEKQGKEEIQHDSSSVNLRSLCFEDFVQAKTTIGASVSYDAASIVQLRQWNERYGEGGSRRGLLFGFAN